MPIIVDPSVPNPPPPQEAESSDHILHAIALPYGVYLEAEFPAGPIVTAVRFLRKPEIPVRSGNDAVAVGGYAESLDAEAPLGSPSTWIAYPIYADGSLGAASAPVSLTSTTPSDPYNSWLKSIMAPETSMRVFVTKDQLPTFTYAARNNLSNIQGSPYPAGSRDLHLQPTPTLTCYTDPGISRESMVALLTSGPVLFQTRPEYHLPDFYALIGDLEMSLTNAGVASDVRLWTIPLTEIARPSSLGASLSVVGRNYEDIDSGLTYDQYAAIFPTYADAGRPAE